MQRNLIASMFLLLCFISSKAQKPVDFSKQLSLITENDFYLLQGKDGYYTNGIILNYSKIHHSRRTSFLKQVDEFELGQKLFTPFSRKIYNVSQIDRPVTGYLYGKFLRTNFLKQNRFLQFGVSVGAIGKASLGEWMQDTYHNLININSSLWGWIWDYQLKSAFGLNLHGEYAKTLLNDGHSFLQITPVTKVTLGTIFTNASEGILFQLGKLNSQSESVYWNAALQEKQDNYQSELFFYYYPQVTGQMYNATVQGGLFNKDKGAIVSDPEPFVFLQQFGAMYSFKRYSLRMAVTFTSKEAKSQKFNHKYGTIQVNYRFN